MTTMKSDTPKTYLFRYATAVRLVGSIEVVVVAKSMRELETIWRSMSSPDAEFDQRLVNDVRITRREQKHERTTK